MCNSWQDYFLVEGYNHSLVESLKTEASWQLVNEFLLSQSPPQSGTDTAYLGTERVDERTHHHIRCT